jgi:hypothetical protein
MIATQRIEQLEMELQRNNAKPQQEYPHVQYPQNQNAYINEAADMKDGFALFIYSFFVSFGCNIEALVLACGPEVAEISSLATLYYFYVHRVPIV